MKINWKNVLERALWTFAEGFLSGMAMDQIFAISGSCSAKGPVIMMLTGAIASGVSALKTFLLELAAAKKNADAEGEETNTHDEK